MTAKNITTCALIATIALGLSAQAATFTWTGGGGLDTAFSNWQNWDQGEDLVPGENDTVLFNSSGAIDVSFTKDETTEIVRFLGSMDGSNPPVINLNLDGNTWFSTGSSSSAQWPNYIMPVSEANNPRTLTVQNGTVDLSFGDTGGTIWGGGGSAVGAGGEVIVRLQQDATMKVNVLSLGRPASNPGQTHTATFYVEQGAKLEVNYRQAFIGLHGSDSDGLGVGNVHIDGLGSSMTVRNTEDNHSIVVVGRAGDGTVTIDNGGLLDALRSVNVATQAHANGAITVQGGHLDSSDPEDPVFTPSRLKAASLFIGGGRNNRDSEPAVAGLFIALIGAAVTLLRRRRRS